jgi:ClpX C4-type zinc finger
MSGDDVDYGKAIWELTIAKTELRKSDNESTESPVRPEPPYCSFCRKGKNEVRGMVRGPSVYICADCINAAAKLIESKNPK